jgi:hypothetical protein
MGDCCDKSHQFSRSLALARNSKKQKETTRNSNGPRQENDVGIEAKKDNYYIMLSCCII